MIRIMGTGSAPRQRGYSGPLLPVVVKHTVSPASAGVLRLGAQIQDFRQRQPRVSGGAPSSSRTDETVSLSDPRQRGYSACSLHRTLRPPVSPASAGVSRIRTWTRWWVTCQPRVSGGIPDSAEHFIDLLESAPRQRGYPSGDSPGRRVVEPSPAGAGVSRPGPGIQGWIRPQPRRSGGIPQRHRGTECLSKSAPQERGKAARRQGRCGPPPQRLPPSGRKRLGVSGFAASPAPCGIPEPVLQCRR